MTERIHQPLATVPTPSPYLHETKPTMSRQFVRMRNRVRRELQLQDFVDSGATLKQMAQEFGVTNGRIGQILKKMGLKTLRGRNRRPNRKKAKAAKSARPASKAKSNKRSKKR